MTDLSILMHQQKAEESGTATALHIISHIIIAREGYLR